MEIKTPREKELEKIRTVRKRLMKKTKWNAVMFTILAVPALTTTIIHLYIEETIVFIVVVVGIAITIIELLLALAEYNKYKRLKKHEEEETDL